MTTTSLEESAVPQAVPEPAVALFRMVDFRLPLHWLLMGAITALACAVGMYYELRDVSRGMQQLQIEVKAGNAAYSTLAGEVALLKYRVEGLEAERRAVQPPVKTR